MFVLEVPSETKQLQLWLCPHISLAGSKRCSRCSPAAPAFPTLPFPSSSRQGSGALWNLLGSLRHTSAFGQGHIQGVTEEVTFEGCLYKNGFVCHPKEKNEVPASKKLPEE